MRSPSLRRSDRFRSTLLESFSFIILLAAILYHSWSLLPQVITDLGRVRKDFAQPGLWRSANFSQNLRFANYVKFLNENIPESARVVLPAKEYGPWAGTTTPFMQFFLAPRRVYNCVQSPAACLDDFGTANSYFLLFDVEAVQNGLSGLEPDRIRLFDGDWGIYIPGTGANSSTSLLPPFTSAAEIFKAAALPLIWLAFLTISGYIFSGIFMPDGQTGSNIAVAYGLITGLISLSLFLCLLAGFGLSPLIIVFISVFWFVISLIVRFAMKEFPIAALLENKLAFRFPPRIDYWQVGYLIVGGITALLAVGKGYHATDAIILWGAKGYGIASYGLVEGASQWGTGTTYYTLHIPILIAAFRVLFNESLPASKFIFPLYFVGLLTLIYHYIHQRITAKWAGLGTLALATAPILFRHGTIGYANLAFAFYFIAAVLTIQEALDRSSNAMPELKYFFFSGIFFLLSAWTRPEGFILSALGIGLFSSLLLARKSQPNKSKSILFLAAPLIMFTAVWVVLAPRIYQGSVRESGLISQAISQIFQGNLHISEAAFVLKSLGSEIINTGTWGIIGIGSLLFVVLGIGMRGKTFISPILVLGCLCLAFYLGMYYITSYDRFQDISWWVNTGLDRMIMPGIILLWSGGITSILGIRN
jgi:hypothetical protein